jgi:cobalamin biosynthesis Mg chelatase CobN
VENKKIIEKITLEDGRLAERHTSVDSAGNKVVEVYEEEKRPVLLKKRVIEVEKKVLAEKRVETIGADGQLVDVKVHSIESPKLELREHIGLAENHELNALSYAKNKDVVQAVVAGVQAAFAQHGTQKLSAQSVIVTKAQQAEMEIATRVADKSSGMAIYWICGAILLVNVAASVYFGFFM